MQAIRMLLGCLIPFKSTRMLNLLHRIPFEQNTEKTTFPLVIVTPIKMYSSFCLFKHFQKHIMGCNYVHAVSNNTVV